MQISRLRIQNFRSIKSLDLELGDTTVLIGPNNAGKTAILEALRIALTRRWGQRGTGFTEYDVHLADGNANPKTSGPVVIEIEFSERKPGEWHADIAADLADILIVDPRTALSTIILRVSCAWDPSQDSFVPRWEFLNGARAPLTGKGAKATNLQPFFEYVPTFYLPALRSATDEFSNKSQFWGRLLKTVQIPDALATRTKRVMDLLNARYLEADKRLGVISDTLSGLSKIAAEATPGRMDLRMMPLNPWDLLARAEVVYKCEETRPWLPLTVHGQGVQSLSVMFLFRAFVKELLIELYRPGSSALLAMEEPETHLHPQAARALWQHVQDLPGQKIVSTHSPYFVQRVPFRDLRIVRIGKEGTAISSLPQSFTASIPSTPGVVAHVAKAGARLVYDAGREELSVLGAMDEADYRELLKASAGSKDTVEIQQRLRALHDASRLYVTDDELRQLETFARRIRGEIFFAKKWMLVEGASEYHLVHGLARGLDYDLDENGVSVIDFQNNGNPTAFVALARAFRIPWLIVVDGDTAGKGYLAHIEHRGVAPRDLAARKFLLPQSNLEAALIASGLGAELRGILANLGVPNAAMLAEADLLKALTESKTAYADVLGSQCAADAALAKRLPAPLVAAVAALRTLT